MSSSQYRADIDGLRALAIVPVVLFHASISGFSGGFVGVDVFFVISGYLITSILLYELDAGTFTFAKFYERRVRRLFPALFAVVSVSCVFAYLLLMPTELEDFGESVTATALFGSNFLFSNEADYFAGPAELKPLLHTWSLAIEEQYYLLFPILLLRLSRTHSRAYLSWIVGIGIASFVLCVWGSYYFPTENFYLIPSRMWELMIGSSLAVINRDKIFQPSGWLAETIGVVGLLLIATSVFTFDATTQFPGLSALLPTVGTGLILLAGFSGSTTTVAKVLSLRPIVFVGLISYSLYLWHWPVLVFTKHYYLEPLTLVQSCTLIGLSVLLAVISYYFIEQPFRHSLPGSKRTNIPSIEWSRTGVLRFGAGVIICAVALGLWYDQSEGLPGRLAPEVAAIAQVAEDKDPDRGRCEGMAPEQISYDSLCRISKKDVPPTYLLWGDSHAVTFVRSLRRVSDQLGLNGLNATSNGCLPAIDVYRPGHDPRGECLAFSAAVLEVLRQHPELNTVIIASRWARHANGLEYVAGEDDLSAPLFLSTSDGPIAESVDANQVLFAQAMQRTSKAIAKLRRQVVFIGPVPEIGIDVPLAMAKAARLGRERDLFVPRAEFERRQAFTMQTLRTLATDNHSSFVPVEDRFCDARRCEAVQEGLPIYFDDDHLASSGARRLEPVFLQVLSELLDSNN